MLMPKPDEAVLAKRSEIIARLREIVPGEGVIADEDEMRVYESDALSAYRQMPMIVVLPQTTEQVAEILRYCYGEGVKVVPRGAGTSLSGGALPLADAVLLGLGKFNRILDIDFENRAVVTQPGVTNLGITHAVQHEGFYYAPDPSSQIACSIGGNIAENSGGVHCLKYGLTTNNVLGIEFVTIEGEVIRVGGKHLDSEGYDLLGLMTGSRLARRGDRGDGADPEETVDRARLAGRLRLQRDGGNLRRRGHRCRHHPRRHGDDGQPGDQRGGGFRRHRLSA